MSDDEIVVVPGATAGLALASLCAVGADGESLIITPGYPPAWDFLQILGVKIHLERTSFDQNYQLDIDRIQERLSPRIQLVCLASPNNPGGRIVPHADILQLANSIRMRAPDAIFLIDETFREAAFNGDPTHSSAKFGAPIVTVGSLSKAYGVPGLRIGWIASRDPIFRQRLIEAKANVLHSCSVLDEATAVAILTERKLVLQEQGHVLLQRLVMTLEWMERHSDAVRWATPDAGAIMAFQLRPDRFDAEAVSHFRHCLAEHGVALAPGSVFGDDETVFRLGFGFRSEARLREALDALSRALQQLGATTAFRGEQSQLGELVRNLVARTLPKSGWTHEAHLGACLWLLRHRTTEQVLRELPHIIRRFNESVGTVNSDHSGYHATITEFYIRTLDGFLVQYDRGQPADELFDLLLGLPVATRDYPLRFYSKERLFSVAARRDFVAPDLRLNITHTG